MRKQQHKQHLLVVDDDADVRSLMQLQLQGAGYRVSTAIDGADALEQIRISAPDLIISDILMPELDGFGLCRALRDDPELTQIPVIFITAHYLEPEDEELAQRLGALYFLIKGADQQPLLQVVKEALAHQAAEKNALALRFPELSELACELHLQRLYAQLSKKVQQLLHSEARYRSILDSLPDSILLIDALVDSYPAVYANPAFYHLSGYQLEDIQGDCLALLVRQDNDQAGLRELYSALRNHSRCATVLRCYRQDGGLFWSEIKISPVANACGEISHLVMVMADSSGRIPQGGNRV